MSVTIDLHDANSDGTGIDFLGYLDDYVNDFVRASYGDIDPGTVSGTVYSGTEYAFWEGSPSLPQTTAYQSVIVGAGAADLEYDISTHVLSGSVESVSFGYGIDLPVVGDGFTQTTDIDITGLDVSGSGSGNDVSNLVYGLMTNDVNPLLAEFNDGVTYIGSTGNDVMYGFAGDDTFVFDDGSAWDTVVDFDTDGDLLDVSGWGATGTGDLMMVSIFGDTYITADLFTDTIIVEGVTGLTASDFIFA